MLEAGNRTAIATLADLHRKRRLAFLRAASTGFVALLTGAFPSFAGAQASEPRQLLSQYKCYICHADHQAKAGPAYADVAAQFHGRRDAVSVISAEIRRGVRRGGPWHMPPHPEVSPREARTMARYIMSLDEAPTSAARR